MRTLLPVALASLIALSAIGAWWFMNRPQETTSTPAAAPVSLPRDSGAMISFTTKSGKVVSVPDFTYGHPSVNIEDTTYTFGYVTQSLDGVEADARYGIVYGNDGSLIIGLLEEPLSASRSAAEAKLRELLPLPDTILCELPIQVAVPDTIESTYTGQQLGLSFCPGAVSVP